MESPLGLKIKTEITHSLERTEMKDNLAGRTFKHDSISDANVLLVIFI